MLLEYGSPFPEGERERLQRRAQELGYGFVDLDRIRVDPETRALIPPEMARELRALPVKRDGNTLWVAFDSPSLETAHSVRDATGLRVVPVLCVPGALDEALTA